MTVCPSALCRLEVNLRPSALLPRKPALGVRADENRTTAGVAARSPVALYVEDVTTAAPSLVNREYELKYFRHRALVHAPLYHEGLMYGILEPCVMEAARVWSSADREIIAMVQERIAPIAATYVARNCRCLGRALR